jgi:hypothetical protein
VGRIRRSTTLASMTRLLPEDPNILTPEYQMDYIPKTEVRRPAERFTKQHSSVLVEDGSRCSELLIRPPFGHVRLPHADWLTG